MSLRVDSSELIAGAYVIGNTGHGVLGSEVPSTGVQGPSFIYGKVVENGLGGNEVRGLVVTPPGVGVFFASEDGSFLLSGAPDGVYPFTYRLYVDGVELGEFSYSITIGASENSDLSGAIVMGGVTASGLIVSTPPGTFIEDATRFWHVPYLRRDWPITPESP